MYDYAADVGFYHALKYGLEPDKVPAPPKPPANVEHGITFRKRVVLSRWGIERTKRGYAVNMGKFVFYVR